MQIWLDTINLKVIKDASTCGILSGITTNPSILSLAEHGHVRKTLDNLLTLQEGPVAVQVTEEDSAAIVEEARSIFSSSQRIIIKIFANKSGFAAIRQLREESIPVLATGIFRPTQALLAANLGGAYIAPYFSHIGESGVARKTLETIVSVLRSGGYRTKILVASVNSLEDLVYCAELGVEAVTIKGCLYEKLVADCQLVENFSVKFLSDWRKQHGDASLKDLLAPAGAAL